MIKYDAIILAAGNSTRSELNYNKVLFEINGGQKIIEVSTKNFLLDNDCQKVFLVCKEQEKKIFEKIFQNVKKMVYVTGGETRQESVKNALKFVNEEYVFIHDGARPYFTPILLNRLKDKLKTYDSIIPVWSLKDTIKLVKNGIVEKTLKRDNLKLVQTPQAFKTEVIKKAHELATRNDYTDDSSMVEDILHGEVAVIDGEYSNIKFTFKEDF